jgi:hypothetical protein
MASLGGAWRRFRSWPRWVQISLGVAILLGAVPALLDQSTDQQSRPSERPAATETRPEQQAQPSASECSPVGSTYESAISDLHNGAKVQGEMFSVPSRIADGVRFIAAKVNLAPTSDRGIPNRGSRYGLAAVWATNGDPQGDDLRLIVVANDVARRYSDLGIDVPLDSPLAHDLALDDAGDIAAAEACVGG